MRLDSIIVIYSALVVAASLLGSWITSQFKLTHLRMQFILSFVGGFMLGIGLLHLLPHAMAQTGSVDLAIGATLVGLLFMFFLIRTLEFHQHEAAQHGQGGKTAEAPHVHPLVHGGIEGFRWAGVFLGLSIHALIDGIALGAAVLSESGTATHAILPGFGVFAAILLHKPLDALSIASLMIAGGWSLRACRIVSAGFALICPVGALLVVLPFTSQLPHSSVPLGAVLGFSAGVFLCISLSDLLPEVHFHRHDRVKLSAALLLGVALAYGIGVLEHEQAHEFSVDVQKGIPSP
jgi:zinc and cadmium transporter